MLAAEATGLTRMPASTAPSTRRARASEQCGLSSKLKMQGEGEARKRKGPATQEAARSRQSVLGRARMPPGERTDFVARAFGASHQMTGVTKWSTHTPYSEWRRSMRKGDKKAGSESGEEYRWEAPTWDERPHNAFKRCWPAGVQERSAATTRPPTLQWGQRGATRRMKCMGRARCKAGGLRHGGRLEYELRPQRT